MLEQLCNLILTMLEVVAWIDSGVLEDQILKGSIIDDTVDKLHVVCHSIPGLNAVEPAGEGKVQVVAALLLRTE